MDQQKALSICRLCLVLCLLGGSTGIPLGGSSDIVNHAPVGRLFVDFPAFCVLNEGHSLQRFDGTKRTLPIVAGETFMNLCSDPSQFHVTVTITGSYENKTAHMYLTVKDGSRVVKASIKQNQNFQYNSYNEGGYDCLSMAGVQTVVRNFGESLVIETGFASIILNKDLNLHSYMVQNPRSPVCGICGRVDDMTEICANSIKQGSPPMASSLEEASHSAEKETGTKQDHHVHWSYDSHGEGGPSHWGQISSDACDMARAFSRQSPIDIETESTKFDPSAPIPRYRVTNSNTQAKLFNSGHSPVLVPINASCLFTNVPYSWGEYRLLGLHLHFGPNSHSGSEHTVNGKPYAGEVHFVHYNTRYGGLGEALKHPDGLAVVGVFLEESDGTKGPRINPGISEFMDHILSIPNKEDKSIMTIDMSTILPTEADLSSYYTYDGSLTTPACDEIVRWIVLSKPWGITGNQLATLRLLRIAGEDSEPMGVHGNARPAAPLNGRTVIRREPLQSVADKIHNVETELLPPVVAYVEPAALALNEADFSTPAPASTPVPTQVENHKDSHKGHEHVFDYDVNSPSGPLHWSDQDAGWGGCDASRTDSRQSPIDVTTSAFKRSTVHNPLSYNLKTGPLPGKLRNNGHSPVFEFDSADRVLSGVPHTSDQYELLQFHIHFGPDDVTGSEHLMDGKAFPAELQFVHKNKKYTSIGEALKHEDGLAVIGVFVELSPDTTDPTLQQIVSHFTEIETVGHDVALSVDPNYLLPSATYGIWTEYMTYPGSLTTPGCFEVVTWIILPGNLRITSQELQKARSLLTGGTGSEALGKMGNFRPPQPMNHRQVEYVTVDPDAPDESHKGHVHNFDYNINSPLGPLHWAEQDPTWGACDSSRTGSRQSPIDIPRQSLAGTPGDPLIYNTLTGRFNGTLKNNGHAPAFEFDGVDRVLTGVPHSADEYELLQFHLHFGPDDNSGSEHTIDGKAFPAEIHFVHKNRKYPTVGEALQREDGLAVIGVLVEVSPEGTSQTLQEIIANLDAIQEKGHGVHLSLDPGDLMPFYDTWTQYMTYPGSLTTPGCFEVVRWIILQQSVTLTSQELQKFRSLLSGKIGSEPLGTMGNFRLPQPLNGRQVELMNSIKTR